MKLKQLDTEPAKTTTGYHYLVSLMNMDPANVTKMGNKAANLAKMIQNNLPVPMGYVLSTDAFDIAGKTAILPKIYLDEVMHAIDELGGRVALRSSATVEDGENVSMAGVFETHYVINANRNTVRDLIRQAYRQARSSKVRHVSSMYGFANQDIKLGLIVQKLVRVKCAGVLYSTSSSDKLMVQYIDTYGQALVDGEKNGTTVVINKGNGLIESSLNFDNNPMSESITRELAAQSNNITALFGNPEQDIEFAVSENDRLYIVQARTLTRKLAHIKLRPTPYEIAQATQELANRIIGDEMNRLGTTKAILHLNNIAELLPRPTHMDIGIFQHVFSGHNGMEGAAQLSRRRMGYSTNNTAIGYVHYIGGRAYESLAVYAGNYYCGFPETAEEYFATLVYEYLDLVYAYPSRASYPGLGLFLRNPTMQDLRKRFGPQRSIQFMDIVKAFQTKINTVADNFLQDFPTTRYARNEAFIAEKKLDIISKFNNHDLLFSYNEILEHLRTESAVDFDTAAHLGFYFTEQLKQLLMKHFAVTADQADKILLLLIQGLDGSSVTEANIDICKAPSDDEARKIAAERISHYPTTGEILEIHNPRMQDHPKLLNEYVKALRSGDNYATKFANQKKKRLVEQERLLTDMPELEHPKFLYVMGNAQKYLALRETIKDQFTQEYMLLRQRLVEIEKRAEIKKGMIFHLKPAEISLLINNHGRVKHLVKARAQEYALYQKIHMPSLLRHDTVEKITQTLATNKVFTQATGQSISSGKAVNGTVVNMDEFDNSKSGSLLMDLLNNLYNNGEHVILVARVINLTHDPYINKASGLILERAGLVSHGAQRAREIGVGGLSGIDTSMLRTGMQIFFDPANGLIRNIAWVA
ncbi:MAG: PEP/pyruvate-binding domain-containing protein [Patescibacteria group bacterium]